MAIIIDGTNGISDVDGSASTPAIRGTDINTGIFFPAADTIAFAKGGIESMRITSAGGISFNSSGTAYGTTNQVLQSNGNATPTWTSTITSPTLVTPALGTPTSGTLTNCTFPTLNQNTTGSAATFTSTSQNSQFNSIGVGTAGSGTAGEIRATNNITAYYSDERLKTKIGSIENALDKVKQIETMVYHANETAVALGYDASIIEVGVTAQSVQKVMPQTVAPAPIDDKYLTVRYERLIPLLIEAIKELETQVAELKIK
jgi:hypothetical protein